MTEEEFLLNIIELKKTKTIYLEEKTYKDFEGYRNQFESSIHEIKKLKKKIVNLAIDNDEKIFDRDSGGVINSANPCVILREDYGTSTEEVTLSDFIITLKKFHYSVLNDLAYVYSFSCSENTVGIRWDVLEKLEKSRINITYNEFLCLKTGEFSDILKELITGDHGDKLLEVEYIEKLKFLSNLHAHIKDGIECQNVRLKHSFADFYYVIVVFDYGQNEKSTVTVSCNKKEYAKMKLLM